MPQAKFDIYPRIFAVVVATIKLTQRIPKTEENKVIIAQLLRSITSMGANAEEADGVSNKKDFIHCFTIVRKEGKESSFWIKLLGELNPALKNEFTQIGNELYEIVAIVSKIISNSRNHKC